MQAINFSTARQNFKEICDTVCDKSEVYIITRKEERNVVLMSLEKYNEIEKMLMNINSFSARLELYNKEMERIRHKE